MRCVIPSAGVVIAQFDHNAQRARAARYVNIISYPLLATLADRHPYDSQSTTYRIIGSCGKLNLIFNMLPDKSSIGIDRRGNGCASRATQRTHQTGSPSAAARTHALTPRCDVVDRLQICCAHLHLLRGVHYRHLGEATRLCVGYGLL